METELSVGTRYQVARKGAGLNQDQAAEKLGVSKHTVSRWERGDHDAPFGDVIRMAELYEVSLDWLAGRTSTSAVLRAGHTMVDKYLVERIEDASRRQDAMALRDVVVRPSVPYAYDIPEQCEILQPSAARALYMRIEPLLAVLDAKR